MGRVRRRARPFLSALPAVYRAMHSRPEQAPPAMTLPITASDSDRKDGDHRRRRRHQDQAENRQAIALQGAAAQRRLYADGVRRPHPATLFQDGPSKPPRGSCCTSTSAASAFAVSSPMKLPKPRSARSSISPGNIITRCNARWKRTERALASSFSPPLSSPLSGRLAAPSSPLPEREGSGVGTPAPT